MEIAIIFFLILLNGIFSMSEIAMVSSNVTRLEKAAKNGDSMAKSALELKNNPGKFLSTVQIGITLIGLLTGIYSGDKIEDDLELYISSFAMLEPYSEPIAFTVIVITLTFFSLVLGELLPKRIGLAMPETISRIFSTPMRWISVVAAPFIWLLTATTDIIFKIFKITPSQDSHVTEDEIRALLHEGTQLGSVQQIEQTIVDNVFHLGDRRIKTLMTQRMDINWIDIDDAPEVTRRTITGSVNKSFPVCRGELDNVLGMLHSKQLLDELLKTSDFNLEQLLQPALFLHDTSDAYKALSTLRESKQHAALVVDEFGSVQGVLTMSDLIEALVGDFTQHLHDEQEIIPREDGSFLVDASVPLPEFARYFSIDIMGEERFFKINSVGGLVIYLVKRLPETGLTVEWMNLKMEIVDMDGRRIDKLLVSKIEAVAE
jgi:putative hemolysin